MNSFDDELERELRRTLDPVVVSPAPPRRRPRQVVTRSAGAALAARALAAVAILLVVAAASEAVVARSLNPVDWSRQVGQQLHIAAATPPPASPRPSPVSTAQAGSAVVRSPSPKPVLPALTPLPTPPALPSVKPTCVPLNVIAGTC